MWTDKKANAEIDKKLTGFNGTKYLSYCAETENLLFCEEKIFVLSSHNCQFVLQI